MNHRARLSFILLVATVTAYSAFGQHAANANTAYQQLRGLMPGTDIITVKDVVVKRDAAEFTFHSGSFAFYSPVNGKVTGAVFKGEGHLHITPPTPEERHSLAILTRSDPVPSEEFDEDFDQVVLRFTDSTADELRKASTGAGQPDNAYSKAAEELRSFMRHHAEGVRLEPPQDPPPPPQIPNPNQPPQRPSLKQAQKSHLVYYPALYGNLDLRLLEDILSPVQGGFYMAEIHGNQDTRLFFIFDPNGVDGVAPEEIALLKWSAVEGNETIPLSFHRAAEYANGTASGNEHNAAYKIVHQDLDVSIEKNGFLTNFDTIEVEAEQNGVAVIPFDLYPTLRVSQVASSKGDALDWVQEGTDQDPNFGVVLSSPLKMGESTTIKVAYGGKDVILAEGGGNYYPIARENWFPNSNQGFGDYTTYHMLFHVPKELAIVATGTKLREVTEGKITTSEWKTETALPVIGFSVGAFAMREEFISKQSGARLVIDAYANTRAPDILSDQNVHDQLPHYEARDNADFGRYQVGTIDPTKMLPMLLSEGRAAAQIYTEYFGDIPFSNFALTQQFACSYGQSWPMLVYLPVCGYLDQTQQIAFNLQPWDIYWKVVTPHEVAHQWWINTVGFRSYRDQWMSEGFAHESASMYLQLTRSKPDDYLYFWEVERRLLTEKNAYGFRPVDVGPVTMGFRLSSPKTGWDVYQSLVYPKGAYILHMIRMMMWSPKDGDARFKATMHDFVDTYRLKPATTEDFKAIVEKHMSPQMDLDGNHKMDWFFREYVYGTDLPTYHFQGGASPSGDGWNVHINLSQTGVPSNFKMLVPIYLELADGKVMRLGSATIFSDKPIDQTIQLPKLPAAIKKVMINYYYDVLCVEN